MTFHLASKQQGLAMITALMVLIALTLIVLSGSRNSTMQLRMSSNLQSRVDALEYAQAGLDFVKNNNDIKAVTGVTSVCYGDMSTFYVSSVTTYSDNCTPTGPLPSPIDTKTGLILVRETALEGDLPPNMATSVGLVEASYFRVYSAYDNTSNGQGRTMLGGGLMKLQLSDSGFQ
jgi:hypothetical protein